MRTKALLLGARPEPFEGPWVEINDALEWRADPRGDYGKEVIVEVESSDGRCSKRVIATEGLKISGARARGVVVGKLENGIRSVTIQLTEVKEYASEAN